MPTFETVSGRRRPRAWTRLKRRFSGGVQNLPKVYAVDDVSFVVDKGETVGLVGESGCGKSTLVRALTRLIDVSDGTIKLNDRELSLQAGPRICPRPGSRPHPDGVSGRRRKRQSALHRLRCHRRSAETVAQAARQGAHANGSRPWRRQCGLPLQLLTRFPHQLSGGQRARVGIARAIAVEPELLVLDEPTAALDVSVQVVILQLLERLKKEFGMSYLFVSHDLCVVRLLCDRVLVMYLGKIVEMRPGAAKCSNIRCIPTPRRWSRPCRACTRRQRAPAADRRAAQPDRSGSAMSAAFTAVAPAAPMPVKLTMPELRSFGDRQVACHFAEEFLPKPRKPRFMKRKKARQAKPAASQAGAPRRPTKAKPRMPSRPASSPPQAVPRRPRQSRGNAADARCPRDLDDGHRAGAQYCRSNRHGGRVSNSICG